MKKFREIAAAAAQCSLREEFYVSVRACEPVKKLVSISYYYTSVQVSCTTTFLRITKLISLGLLIFHTNHFSTDLLYTVIVFCCIAA